jgi:hypothetical protein
VSGFGDNPTPWREVGDANVLVDDATNLKGGGYDKGFGTGIGNCWTAASGIHGITGKGNTSDATSALLRSVVETAAEGDIADKDAGLFSITPAVDAGLFSFTSVVP